MLSVANGELITKEDLSLIPTPEWTETWHPVPHREVYDLAQYELGEFDIDVEGQAFVKKEGKQLWLQFLVGPEGLPSDIRLPPDDVQYSLVMVNSHDKSKPLMGVAGASVFVCSNGVFTGDYQVRRKHTGRINPHEVIHELVGKWTENLWQVTDTQERLKNHRISEASAALHICNLAEAGAVAGCDIVPAMQRFREPEYPEFLPWRDTGWGLLNALNSSDKFQGLGPETQTKRLQAFHEELVPA